QAQSHCVAGPETKYGDPLDRHDGSNYNQRPEKKLRGFTIAPPLAPGWPAGKSLWQGLVYYPCRQIMKWKSLAPDSAQFSLRFGLEVNRHDAFLDAALAHHGAGRSSVSTTESACQTGRSANCEGQTRQTLAH